MADPKAVLIKLTQNLNTLREREAKYGGNAPLELLNQIEDHEKAIALTEQVIDGELSQAEWREALRSLTIDQTIVEGGLIQRLLATITGDTAQQHALRNRQVMLQAVKEFWVKGVLENSLHNAVLLELGMAEKREAVVYPWEMVLQTPNQPNRTLPSGTRMVDVFDQHQTLLILGEPGSGKTTMLLELARQTIARAEADPTQPMPVVFNLSSWAERRPPLVEWLVEELNTKYNIPKKIAQAWVDQEALLLLLDGLDEVAQPHQLACVEAINLFRKSSLMPVAVCSRMADYEGLVVKLNLAQAIVLQPLTFEQIDGFLARFGSELSTLKAALQQDPNLLELAQSPLMLSVMTLAYQGVPIEKLPQLNSIEAQRRCLFEVYVQRMLERRGMQAIYPAVKTCRWLAWLAERMVEHSQTTFLIERLQPYWLRLIWQKRVYQTASALIFGLMGGLMFGFFAGSTFGVIAGLNAGLSVGLIMGLMFWLCLGLYLGLSGELGIISPTFKWSWQGLKTQDLGILLVAMLFLGLFCGFFGSRHGLVSGLKAGLFSGLIFGLLGGLMFGLKTGEAEVNLAPNLNIWISLKFGVIAGLLGGVLGGLFGGLRVGVLSGLFGWLIGGGEAFILHFFLRFTLWRSGYIPWRYARFLDYCAERIFLRKVGGGYIFIHRYLMEYFASLELEQTK